MSQEDVANLRAFLETWTSAPEIWPGVVERWRRGEADMALFDPDVTYDDQNLPDHAGQTYRGHEGVLRAAERWVEPFEWVRIELVEIVEAGDRLVSIHRWLAKAQHTGIELDTALAYVWTFREGRILHFQSFLSPEEALAAVGLAD